MVCERANERKKMLIKKNQNVRSCILETSHFKTNQKSFSEVFSLVEFLPITADFTLFTSRSRLQQPLTDPLAHFLSVPPSSCADAINLPQTRRVASGQFAFAVFRAQRLHGVVPQSAHSMHISAPEGKTKQQHTLQQSLGL